MKGRVGRRPRMVRWAKSVARPSVPQVRPRPRRVAAREGYRSNSTSAEAAAAARHGATGNAGSVNSAAKQSSPVHSSLLEEVLGEEGDHRLVGGLRALALEAVARACQGEQIRFDGRRLEA